MLPRCGTDSIILTWICYPKSLIAREICYRSSDSGDGCGDSCRDGFADSCAETLSKVALAEASDTCCSKMMYTREAKPGGLRQGAGGPSASTIDLISLSRFASSSAASRSTRADKRSLDSKLYRRLLRMCLAQYPLENLAAGVTRNL